jgi:hypothetical protein
MLGDFAVARRRGEGTRTRTVASTGGTARMSLRNNKCYRPPERRQNTEHSIGSSTQTSAPRMVTDSRSRWLPSKGWESVRMISRARVGINQTHQIRRRPPVRGIQLSTPDDGPFTCTCRKHNCRAFVNRRDRRSSPEAVLGRVNLRHHHSQFYIVLPREVALSLAPGNTCCTPSSR